MTGLAWLCAARAADRDPATPNRPPFAKTVWHPRTSLVMRGMRAKMEESGIMIVSMPAEDSDSARSAPLLLLISNVLLWTYIEDVSAMMT